MAKILLINIDSTIPNLALKKAADEGGLLSKERGITEGTIGKPM